MIEKILLESDAVPVHLLSALDSRDAALWLRGVPREASTDILVRFLGLPWRMVVSEWYDASVVAALESASTSSPAMIRKRGFVQVVDGEACALTVRSTVT